MPVKIIEESREKPEHPKIYHEIQKLKEQQNNSNQEESENKLDQETDEEI